MVHVLNRRCPYTDFMFAPRIIYRKHKARSCERAVRENRMVNFFQEIIFLVSFLQLLLFRFFVPEWFQF